MEMWLVLGVFKHINVTVEDSEGEKTEHKISLVVPASGAVGMVPVFESEAAAKAFAERDTPSDREPLHIVKAETL